MYQNTKFLTFITIALASLFIFTDSVWAQPINCTLEQSCENCISLDIKILPRERDNYYAVGDVFIYNISVTNIGNNTISASMNIRVLNPDSETIPTDKDFILDLKPQEYKYFAPQIPNQLYNIYPFEASGTYKIKFTMNETIDIYRFPTECSYFNVWSVKYTYSFDVMPRWQKDWINSLVDFQKSADIIANETLNANKNIEKLTNYIFILTLINAILAAYLAEKEKVRLIFKILFYIVLLIIVVSLILVFLAR